MQSLSTGCNGSDLDRLVWLFIGLPSRLSSHCSYQAAMSMLLV